MYTENTDFANGPDAYSNALRTILDRARGRVVLPGSADYDNARSILDAGTERYPAAVLYAADVQDVILAVNVARDNKLPLAVRSGGHSQAGHSTVDGGILLDLSSLKSMTIDPERRVARAETGLTWGEYAARAQEYGLATTSGDAGTVGLGGLTTGGGIGWMVRKHGMTIDNLLSADIVTADGRLVTASPTENADLFWAVRGGGGNFGVATAFEFQLHPAGMVIGGAVVYGIEESHQVLERYIEFTETAPEELTTMIFMMPAPPVPFIPQERWGTVVTMVAACYTGDLEKGQEVVAPLRALGTPIADILGPMPYVAMFQMTAEASARGNQHDIRSMFTDRFDSELIDTTVAYMNAAPGGMKLFQLRHLGGAMRRVSPDATAFPHRNARYMVSIIQTWPAGSDSRQHIAWSRAFWNAIKQYATGVYVNFLADEGEERLASAYGERNLRRLTSIKRRYDPDNVFRLNQNIKPVS